jgi:DNA segregation ATPase FtsK/SpoIIIE, S-DNA-T family
MKICPTCDATYKDNSQNYCLSDGATLITKKAVPPQGYSRANEITAVVLLALAVLVFLSLVSSSPADRVPFFSTGFDDSIGTRNWIGVVGATIAATLLGVIGWTAYLTPPLMGVIAWRVFQSPSLRPPAGRVAGFALLVVALSGSASLVGINGGIVGAFAAVNSTYLLGTIGAGILLLTMLAASVLLVSRVSFLWVMGHVEVAWSNVMVRIREWNDKRKKDHEEQISQARSRMEKRRTARAERIPEPAPPTINLAEPVPAEAGATRAAAAGATSPFGFAFDDVPATIAEPVPSVAKRAARSGGGTTNGLSNDDLEELKADGQQSSGTYAEAGELSLADYKLPTSDLLNPAPPHIEHKEKELLKLAESLAEKTREFNVAGKVVNIMPGPVVTTFEFKPDPGVKYSRVTGLVDDLCLALKAESIRIDRIPGKAFVGIEVPNRKRETIHLREVVESQKFKESESKLTIALGKTIDGVNYVTDLAKMPHLLIAGATGAGKSVGVNSLVVSILYKAKPDDVKFIMVDPKRLELGLYEEIPHLMHPIIVDPKRASTALKSMVAEMERRYKYLAGWGVRNIDGYNIEAARRNAAGMLDENGDEHPKLPYIVIIIDELADLMMVSGKEVEESITRLAQMARAVGIHLVLATQRPSVDVITGLIKANFPARISFRVSSKVDSRTIIDCNGAESLLGRGDMLFLPPASSQVTRVHGAFVDEKEIARVVEHIKAQGKPVYDETLTKTDEELDDSDELPGRKDPLFWDAVRSVVQAKRASTSLLQRQLRIGYGRAAAILDAMVREGYIGEMDGSTRARPILQKAYEDLQDVAEMNAE